MNQALLGCGPYLSVPSATVLAMLFLIVKPLMYFAFVRAFRYRVACAIPMTWKRAAKLALLRAVLGVVLVGGGSWFVISIGLRGPGFVSLGWFYLYASRIFAWWYVGKHHASIRGARLVGWVVGGMVINIAFDVATVAGAMEYWAVPVGIGNGVIVFIWILEVRGRRMHLTQRFDSDPHCPVCTYNLTGNLSGICPECGTPIAQQAKVMAQ